MSYSRWGNSFWYTYWVVAPGEETRDNALFDVCGVALFTAKELREDMDICLGEVKDSRRMAEGIEEQKALCHDEEPEGDIEELHGYMLEFLKDIDEKYPVL